ncbi:MAG: DUF302 domain-containing protein [Alphaproteobacteria bacterium]|nr:DUF302 domain-containing protein [Alphaproteobacteria bacterium]
MTYYFAKTLGVEFNEAVRRTTQALQKEGFGIITQIDVQDVFKKKLSKEFRPYLILGACNPSMAYEALETEDKVGTMLPCNVVIQGLEGGKTEIAAIDPVASMQAIENSHLKSAALQVQAKLRTVIENL